MTYWDFMCVHPFLGAFWTIFLFSMAVVLVMLLPGSWSKRW